MKDDNDLDNEWVDKASDSAWNAMITIFVIVGVFFAILTVRSIF